MAILLKMITGLTMRCIGVMPVRIIALAVAVAAVGYIMWPAYDGIPEWPPSGDTMFGLAFSIPLIGMLYLTISFGETRRNFNRSAMMA